METLPPYQAALTSSAPSVSTQARLEIRTMKIYTMPKHGDTTDDELELIEMRYRQALALENLVELFADGQLDC